MSASGSAMVRGGLLSNKGAPTMEGAFTKGNDGVDFPQNFDENN